MLYQYATCPFCNKVRAVLDYLRVPYIIVEVNPLTKSELKWSAYGKVPLAVVNGRVVTDSSVIIDAVVGASLGRDALAPSDAREAARRAWVDGVLVKHLTVNLYRSWGEACATFDYLTARNFPPASKLAVKYVGAAAMVLVARKRRAELLPPGADDRAALVAVLDEFIDAMAGTPFFGGASPSVADLSAFGVLRAVAGLPTHSHALRASRAGPWYERVKAAVGGSAADHCVGEAPSL